MISVNLVASTFSGIPKRQIWETFQKLDQEVSTARFFRKFQEHHTLPVLSGDMEVEQAEELVKEETDLSVLEMQRVAAFSTLGSVLSRDHLAAIESLLTREKGEFRKGPPRFDLHIIQDCLHLIY